MARVMRQWSKWWFTPVPVRRLQVFRVLIYLYIPFDILTSRWVAHHGLVPTSWYPLLWIGRTLDIPAPTATGMAIATAALLTLPMVAAAGRGRRIVGPLVALLYFYWCYVAFTYGKVDHDRVALLTALAVLPTVGWRGSDRDIERRGGWALGMVQFSFALTYFLAGVTKLLVGGMGWITSTTLERAIARRGTVLGDLLLYFPVWVLHVMQAMIVAFELTAPLMLVRNKLGRAYVWGAVLFHVLSFIGITIYFRSHLIAVLAFMPLERVYDAVLRLDLFGPRRRERAEALPSRSPG